MEVAVWGVKQTHREGERRKEGVRGQPWQTFTFISNVIQRMKRMEVALWGVKQTHREMTDFTQLPNWRNLQPVRTSSTGRWLLGQFLRRYARWLLGQFLRR